MNGLKRAILTCGLVSAGLGGCMGSRPTCERLAAGDSLSVVNQVSATTRANFELSRAGRFEESFQRFAQTSTGAADGTLILTWEAHRTRTVLPFLASLDSVAFSLGDFVVTPLGRDAAVVVGKYSFSANRGGQRLSNPSTAFTWVMAKRGDNWEIVYWHTSNP